MWKIQEEGLWAGTEASLASAIKAEELREQRMAAGQSWDSKDDGEMPRLLEVEDGIGYINIKGSLNNNNDADWNDWLGMTGYPEIRDAMIAAATNADVKHVVLNISSGGGTVSGLEDTAKLIRMVNDRVKPVTAYTDSAMYSAAYWLGASAGSVYASKSAGLGSIGVIATHMERADMLKEMGVGVTVVRAGKYKALANSVEKLTEEGKAQIQAGVDVAYGIFKEHVAEMRGKSVEYVESVMAQGREFYGQAAADAGLIDAVKSFDEVVDTITVSFVAPSIKTTYTRGQQAGVVRAEVNEDATTMKKALTEKDLAALASGMPVDQVAEAPVEDEPKADDAVQAPEAGVEVDAKVEQSVQEDATSAATIKLLAEQLKGAQDDLLNAKVEMSRMQDKINEMNAVVGPLKDIAARAINNMRVALGGSVIDMSAAQPAQVLADHVSVSESFASKFKVGGVASTDANLEAKKDERKVDALTQARLKAVGINR
jgi:signal peptide peptidase SppA